MPKYFYVACDGGLQNTLNGGGGILEIRLEPSYSERYHEFPDGMGASPHFIKQSPNKRYLVMSCGNSGQIYVFAQTADGQAYDIENPFRILRGFNTLNMPVLGPDGTTDFFDFWGEGPADEESENIVTHYNRQLIKVNILTEKITVLNDLSVFIQTNPPPMTDLPTHRIPPCFLHQISVHGDFIIIDDALGECIMVLKKVSSDKAEMLYCSGDGYTGGHHCVYKDSDGEVRVARPSFNFDSFGAAFILQDNTLSLFTISEVPEKRKVHTYSYAYYQPNHAPVDLYVENGFLYGAFGIPGSVLKFELKTGRIVAKHEVGPPWLLWRLVIMATDYFSWVLNHGTFLKKFDQTSLDLQQHVHAIAIGFASGTRGGFFALSPDPDPKSNLLFACHRGNNELYCFQKDTLEVLWKRRLPKHKRNYSRFHSSFFRWNGYLAEGLGTHHGRVVSL